MILAGTKLCIKGDWDATPAPVGRVAILLVPQQGNFAFGNAWKPSTRAFLDDLENLITPGCTVLDIGTGVGVLALGAVLLGASKVTAVEPLDIGIDYASRNIEANGLTDRITLVQGWYPVPVPPADLVLCNIDTFEVLEQVLGDHLAPKVAMMPDTREFAQFEALTVSTGYRIATNRLADTYSDSYNYVVVEAS